MSSYPVQANSLVAQDPQAQNNSSQTSRTAVPDAPHVSALPEDKVTISAAAKSQQNTTNQTNATPNKPAPPKPHEAANSPQKG